MGGAEVDMTRAVHLVVMVPWPLSSRFNETGGPVTVMGILQVSELYQSPTLEDRTMCVLSLVFSTWLGYISGRMAGNFLIKLMQKYQVKVPIVLPQYPVTGIEFSSRTPPQSFVPGSVACFNLLYYLLLKPIQIHLEFVWMIPENGIVTRGGSSQGKHVSYF